MCLRPLEIFLVLQILTTKVGHRAVRFNPFKTEFTIEMPHTLQVANLSQLSARNLDEDDLEVDDKENIHGYMYIFKTVDWNVTS